MAANRKHESPTSIVANPPWASTLGSKTTIVRATMAAIGPNTSLAIANTRTASTTDRMIMTNRDRNKMRSTFVSVQKVSALDIWLKFEPPIAPLWLVQLHMKQRHGSQQLDQWRCLWIHAVVGVLPITVPTEDEICLV